MNTGDSYIRCHFLKHCLSKKHTYKWDQDGICTMSVVLTICYKTEILYSIIS